MKVGRSHNWYYDKGEWKEKKITPDKWEFAFDVNKRRSGQAPEGSGVPIGTEYHWYILVHQNVRKLDAVSVEIRTFLKNLIRQAHHATNRSSSGVKYHLVHKRIREVEDHLQLATSYIELF